jgi:hypothetical protein
MQPKLLDTQNLKIRRYFIKYILRNSSIPLNVGLIKLHYLFFYVAYINYLNLYSRDCLLHVS